MFLSRMLGVMRIVGMGGVFERVLLVVRAHHARAS